MGGTDSGTLGFEVDTGTADEAGNALAAAWTPANTLTLEPAPLFSTTISDQSYTAGSAITTLTLPAATGGDANTTLTYTLSPALPTGLTFSGANRTITGTPGAAKAETEYTYTVTETDSDSASLKFKITVVAAADTAPSFGSGTIADQSLTQNSAMTSLTLPAATGGNGTLSYSISPALPAGLTFTAATRVLSGTPTGTSASATYTYTVTDGDGNTAATDKDTITFTIAVAGVSGTTPSNFKAVALKQSVALSASTTGTVTKWQYRYKRQSANATNSNYSSFSPWTDFPSSAGASLDKTVTGLRSTRRYIFQVRALNGTNVVAASGDSAAVVPLSYDHIHIVSGTAVSMKAGGNISRKQLLLGEALTGTETVTLVFSVANSSTLVSVDADPDIAGMRTGAKGHQSEVTLTASNWKSARSFDLISTNTHTSTGTATVNISVKAGSKASYIGRTASLSVTLSQGSRTLDDTAPSFGTNTIADLSLTQNIEMTEVTLPSATGGNGISSYAITPALPAGLSFNAGTRVLSGKPTGTSASTTYTYTVWDGDNNTASSDEDTLTFTIAVAAAVTDTAPSFGSSTIANQSLTQNTPMSDLTLPSATGGNGTLSYSISPALPAGLTFTAATRVLSGTPSASSASATYTYTVSDGDGNTASTDEDTITFTIEVAAAVTDTAPVFADNASIANQSLTQNTPMSDLTLPEATGGNGSLSYSISPALPAGLSFNTGTRTLSGTPTGTSASTTYTYTVSDGDGNTADSDEDTLTFTITVTAAVTDTAPVFADNASIANQSLTQNSAMTVVTLPSATGGNGTLSYAITPALPAGLTFNASSRVLSGTPTGTSVSATYTYTVSDGDNNTAATDEDTLTFTIVVAAEPDTAPAFADNASIADQSLTQNSAMTLLTLPAATGGNGALSYSISPSLPAGLTFNASSRVLSGTPTGTSASATYTYTVSDADSNTADTDKDTLTFTIEVAAAATDTGTDTKPAWLARFGRTVAEQVLDGVRGRLDAPRTPGEETVTLAGQPLALSGAGRFKAHGADARHLTSEGTKDPLSRLDRAEDSRTLTDREALLGTSFALTGETDEAGGTLAWWGRTSQSAFEGRDGTLTLDGDVTTGLVGADYGRGDWLAGLVFSHTEAEGGYTDGSVGSGTLASSLTAVTVYGAIDTSPRTELWGAVGRGQGDVTMKPKNGANAKADIDWTMAATGVRSTLAEPGEGGDLMLALVSDALWANTGSEEAGQLRASRTGVTRLRLGLEAGWPQELDGGGRFAPRLEAGIRHDGGDAETGFGVELGGGLTWSHPQSGLAFDLEGRALLTHEDDDIEDRGFSAGLAFDQAPASERGLSLSLRRTLGAASSGGLDALFAPDVLSERTGAEAAGRWTAEAAWGFPAFGGRYTGSPHAGLGVTDTARDTILGWRLTPAGPAASDFSLSILATKRESDGAETEHRVGIMAGARW